MPDGICPRQYIELHGSAESAVLKVCSTRCRTVPANDWAPRPKHKSGLDSAGDRPLMPTRHPLDRDVVRRCPCQALDKKLTGRLDIERGHHAGPRWSG